MKAHMKSCMSVVNTQGAYVIQSSLAAFSQGVHLTDSSWYAFAAVRVIALPEWAFRRLESQIASPADGVGRECRGAEIFCGDDPLPQSSAALPFLGCACSFVGGCRAHARRAGNLLCDLKLQCPFLRFVFV